MVVKYAFKVKGLLISKWSKKYYKCCWNYYIICITYISKGPEDTRGGVWSSKQCVPLHWRYSVYARKIPGVFLTLQVDFTFDKTVMSELLTSCRDLLLKLVNTHLTTKSHGRINHVFNHYSDPELLTKLYDPNGPFRPNLTRIYKGLNKMVEDGTIWQRKSDSMTVRHWEIYRQTQLRLWTVG